MLRGVAPRFCLSGPHEYKEGSRSPQLKELRAGREVERESAWEPHGGGICVMGTTGAPGLRGQGSPMQRQKGVSTHGPRQGLNAIH